MEILGAARHVALKDIPEIARTLESLGYDTLHQGETKADVFLPVLLAAEHTTRLKVATNVAIAFARSPMVLAYASWNLQAFSNGRFKLGLGTQVKAHIPRRFGMPWDRPVGRLKEYV